jgi:hypothetical protein
MKGTLNSNIIIFGPKKEEVAGEWRRLHNEEFHNVFSSIR